MSTWGTSDDKHSPSGLQWSWKGWHWNSDDTYSMSSRADLDKYKKFEEKSHEVARNIDKLLTDKFDKSTASKQEHDGDDKKWKDNGAGVGDMFDTGPAHEDESKSIIIKQKAEVLLKALLGCETKITDDMLTDGMKEIERLRQEPLHADVQGHGTTSTLSPTAPWTTSNDPWAKLIETEGEKKIKAELEKEKESVNPWWWTTYEDNTDGKWIDFSKDTWKSNEDYGKDDIVEKDKGDSVDKGQSDSIHKGEFEIDKGKEEFGTKDEAIEFMEKWMETMDDPLCSGDPWLKWLDTKSKVESVVEPLGVWHKYMKNLHEGRKDLNPVFQVTITKKFCWIKMFNYTIDEALWIRRRVPDSDCMTYEDDEELEYWTLKLPINNVIDIMDIIDLIEEHTMFIILNKLEVENLDVVEASA